MITSMIFSREMKLMWNKDTIIKAVDEALRYFMSQAYSPDEVRVVQPAYSSAANYVARLVRGSQPWPK